MSALAQLFLTPRRCRRQAAQGLTLLVRPDGGDPYNGTCEAGIFNGSANGTTLTVTSVSSGKLQPSQAIIALPARLHAYVITRSSPARKLAALSAALGHTR
jgi:hypothetical protein